MHVDGYRLTRRLASGTSGTVYAADAPPHRAAGRVAVKLVPAARVSQAVLREVRHLHALAHPSVLTLHRVARVPAPPPAPAALALVTELLPAGDLFDAVAAAGARLRPAFVRLVLRDVVRALLYLKRKRVVHADIKLENVGLVLSHADWAAAHADRDDDDEPDHDLLRRHPVVAKIIDFGTSRPPSTLDSAADNARPIGTALYLAPELLRAGATREAPSYATDAWAMGVLLYSTLCGWYPFEPEPTTESDDEAADESAGPSPGSLPSTEAVAFASDYARDAILSLPPRPLPARVPRDLRALVHGLLRKDPRSRLTVEDVVARLGGETLAEARAAGSLPTPAPFMSSAARPPLSSRPASAARAIPGATARRPSGTAHRRNASPLSVTEAVMDTASVADSDEAEDEVASLQKEENDDEEQILPGPEKAGLTAAGVGSHDVACESDDEDFQQTARSQTLDDMMSIVEHIQRQLSEPNLCSRSSGRRVSCRD